MPRNRKDDIHTKIQVLRKRHDRWLNGKKGENRLAEAKNEFNSEPSIFQNVVCENTSMRDIVNSSNRGDTNDDFLSKLSRKIATQIRNDLNLQSSISSRSIPDTSMVLASHMAELSAEIQPHICQLCHELMSPPEKTPMLLFPCGHTFCAKCTRKDTNNFDEDSFSCPCCNKKIISAAENQSLKFLIEKSMSKEVTGGTSLGEILRTPSLTRQIAKGNATRFSVDQEKLEVYDKEMKMKFETEYRNVAMRHKILSNEYTELMKKRKLIYARNNLFMFPFRVLILFSYENMF